MRAQRASQRCKGLRKPGWILSQQRLQKGVGALDINAKRGQPSHPKILDGPGDQIDDCCIDVVALRQQGMSAGSDMSVLG